MIIFSELLRMLNELDDDKPTMLSSHIDLRQQKVGFQMGDLLDVIDDFRQGLSQSDLDEMFEMMNQE